MDVDLDVLNFNWSIWTKGRKKLIKSWVWQVLGHHKYPLKVGLCRNLEFPER